MSHLRSKLLLASSVVLALGASYSAYAYLATVQRAQKPAPTVAVLTATRDIAARTVISDDMLRIIQMPPSLRLGPALDQLASASGKVSTLPIAQGEQILPSKLTGDIDQSGLAFVIPPGKRAVAVNVNEVVGSGGLILPGDAVDVVAVIDTQPASLLNPQDRTAPETTSVAQFILQNVEVLAVAQEIQGAPPKKDVALKSAANLLPTADASALPHPNAKTATLAVSPEEAEKVVLAEDKGRIRLILRSHGDESTIKTDDGLFSSLHGTATLSSRLNSHS